MSRFRVFLMASTVALLSGCARAVTPVVALESPASAPAPPPVSAPAVEMAEVGPDGLLTQAGFALELGRAMESLRPGWQATVLREVMLVLAQDGEPGPTLPIGPVYAKYRSQAENKAELIRSAAADAIHLHEALRNWEQAQRWLQPVLVSSRRVAELIDEGAMPVVIPQSDEVTLLFEVRIYGKSQLVHLGLQAHWSQPDEALYTAALENLADTASQPVRGADGVWRFHADKGQIAARILLVDRLSELAAQVSGRLILAIPSEESLYAFPADDAALIEQMRWITEQEFRTAERPLSMTWLTLKDGQLRPHQL